MLGLATGSTPLSLYAELVRLHREEALSFADVVAFNLDEYYPMVPEHPQSYHRFMRTHLFTTTWTSVRKTSNAPRGDTPRPDLDRACADYEERIAGAGGIDLQILGIGRTGHIGFNEPGSPRRSRTRLVTLDPITRRDAAGDFGGEENTPRQAITMGVRTILGARRIVLPARLGPAQGCHHAAASHRRRRPPGPKSPPASYLQEHDQVHFVLDHAAAGALTRHRTPWLIGPLGGPGLWPGTSA